jgi:hypothetical protein
MCRPRERISDRAHRSEREISDGHMGGFSAEGSRGLAFIQRMCRPYRLTRESLVVLAQVFSAISGVPFRRDFTRRRTLVIKWFDDHIERLEPLGALIALDAVDMRPRDG